MARRSAPRPTSLAVAGGFNVPSPTDQPGGAAPTSANPPVAKAPSPSSAKPHQLGHRERLRARFLDAGPDA